LKHILEFDVSSLRSIDFIKNWTASLMMIPQTLTSSDGGAYPNSYNSLEEHIASDVSMGRLEGLLHSEQTSRHWRHIGLHVCVEDSYQWHATPRKGDDLIHELRKRLFFYFATDATDDFTVSHASLPEFCKARLHRSLPRTSGGAYQLAAQPRQL
jgi:hypothetical protein